MRSIVFYVSLLFLSACSLLSLNSQDEPRAEKKARVFIATEDARADEYAWLSDRENPQVRDHLVKEKKYADLILEKSPVKTDVITEEILQRINVPKNSLIDYIGEYQYDYRFLKGAEYPIYYRKNEKKEEEILNVPTMAKGKSYYQVSGVSPSLDGRYLAYGVDEKGRRNYEIRFKDLQTKKTLPVKIKGVTSNFFWAKDGQHIFYTKQDKKTLRWNQIWRFNLDDYKASLVYEELDKEYSIYLTNSSSQKIIFINIESSNSSEVRYLDGSKPLDNPILVQGRMKGVKYQVQDGGDRFYIRTNYNAVNYKLVKVIKAQGKLGIPYWRDILGASHQDYLERFQVYEDFIVTQIKKGGNNKFKVISRSSKLASYFINFDDDVYLAKLGSYLPYKSAAFRYSYESIMMPKEDMAYQVFKKEPTVEREEIVPHFNSSDYTSELLNVKSHDQKDIPLTLVYKKDIEKNEKTPLLLYAYGAYGYTYEAFFNESLVSLLDRGFIFAIAHVRGGSKKGRPWYEDGKLLKKKNTFKDFLSVANYLIENKMTSPKHLYAMGVSAGGMIMGNIINENPELFNGVIAQVPFVDVLNTMLDETLPLTTLEYREWGNPNEREYYDYIKSYSPYDNINKKKYPSVFATSYWEDSQVQYWEAVKWVSRLRDFNKNSQALLVVDMNFTGGHGGSSGRLEKYKQTARVFSFLLMLESRNKKK